MGLVPLDYPARLAAAGLRVHTIGGWEGRGADADHGAVVLHHTASPRSGSPASVASYSAVGSSHAPDYNVLVDRTGEVWILARRLSNNSGRISDVALQEVLSGRANLTPAAQRGLRSDTSQNRSLFGLGAQNDGIGEPWRPELVSSIATAAAVTLEVLGLPSPGFMTTHRALTERKSDPSGPGCPSDWHTLIAEQMGAPPPASQEAEMTLIPSWAKQLRGSHPTLAGRWQFFAVEDQRLLCYNGLDVKDPLPAGWTKRRTGPACIAVTVAAGVQVLLGVEEAPGAGNRIVLLARDGGTFVLEDKPRPDLE